MAQTYKVSGMHIGSAYSLSGIYHCPAATTAMINSIYLANRNTGTATMADLYLYDSSLSRSFCLMSGIQVPNQATLQPLSAPIILEASDYLQASDVSGSLDVVTNALEIT